MHELALAQGLVTTMLEVARANRVGRIRCALVEIGSFTHVDPESLRFGFEAVAKGTAAEGCVLELRRVPLRARCATCGATSIVDEPLGLRAPGCGRCGAPSLEVLEGRELRLVHIDVDEE